MKKILAPILAVVFLLGLGVCALAAPPSNLTWDGQPATLAQIAQNTGYDLADANGNYKPLYYEYATAQWSNNMFMGSNGSFDLDNPLTRAEGVVMTIRLLGKDNEAKACTAPITFTDVPAWAKPYIAYAVQNNIANGYNATTFGAGDLMTSAQFISLTLRALGYKDGEDFAWNTSYDKALEIGLIGRPCHTQYSRSNLFLRDNAAMISYNAIFNAPTKSGQLLVDILPPPTDKPSGPAPAATRAQVAAQAPAQTPTAATATAAATSLAGLEIIKGDKYFQIHSLPGGNYYATATYYLYAGDNSGPVDFTITVSPTSVGKTKTDSITLKPGYYTELAFGFSITPASYGMNVTNTVKIQVGDFVYTDTIVCNGTLYSVVIR